MQHAHDLLIDPAHAPKGAGDARRLRLGAFTGWPVLILTLGAMMGWVARLPELVRFGPGAPAMVFTTASCLFLLAVALLLTDVPQSWSRRARTAIGVGVLLFGVTVLVQYHFDVALAIDLRAMHAWLDGNPGRMAPNTALACALAGVTLLLATHARPGIHGVPALVGAFAVAMMGITGVVGYRLHAELIYGWHVATRMSLGTAASFVLLGIGFAAAAYRAQRLRELFRQREDLRVGLLGGALTVFVGLVGGLVAFTLLQEQTESVLRDGLKVSLANRQAHLDSVIPSLVHRTGEFVSRPRVRREIARLYAAPGDRAAREAVESVLTRQLDSGLASARLLDAQGSVLMRAGSVLDQTVALPLQLEGGRARLVWDRGSAKLSTGQPFVSEGVELGTIELVYALPVVTHMVEGAQETNASAEMQLCARSGQAIRCLPPRLAPQRTEFPMGTLPDTSSIARALASESGIAFETDYRGARVLAAYGPVDGMGLGMVLKVDVAEIYAPVRRRFELSLLVVGLLVAAVIFLLRARVVPLVRRLAISEQRLRSVLESAPDAMLVSDPGGRIVWSNARAGQLFGYGLAELIGQPVEILIPERFRASHRAKWSGYVARPRSRAVGAALELHGRRKDGSEFPVEIGVSPQETDDGMRVISTVRDVSERKRVIEALRESEQRWQFALEGAGDGVWDWNLATGDVFFSRQWKRMLGYQDDEITGRLEEWDRRVHEDDKARVYADIDRYLKGETPHYENEHRMLCRDGSYKWILDRGMIVTRDRDGIPTRMIGTHTDITARKRAEETIRELSLIDELTGLRNRRGFFILGESQLHLARRLGRTAVLYFADVDGLKRINDQLGHAQGDCAIADVAEVLRMTFRETDLVARLGGDEFVVLALESMGVDTSAAVKRLGTCLERHNHTAERPYRLAMSMGVAQQGPESTESLAELLRRADAEMYLVKQRRRASP